MRRFSIGDWRLAIGDYCLGIAPNRKSKIVNRKSSIALAWCCSIGLAVAAPTVRELILPTTGQTGFTRLTADATGLVFSNHLSDASAAKNRILENGSGVALGDVDGDGWCDIYLCRLEGPNVLYRNLGNWKFTDITARAGVACPDQYSTGAVLADVDGDGDLDLLVNSIGGGTRLFLNDGRGQFKEKSDSGLERKSGSTSMALADFDGDGDLDLYVANYRTTTSKDTPPPVQPEARMVDGKLVVTQEERFMAIMAKAGGVMLFERGEPDFFYLNDGRGRFSAVSWTGGLFTDAAGAALTQPPRDWALSVMFRDFNGDGTPDLYICNDFLLSPDAFWFNEGGRRFRAVSPLVCRNMSMSSMAIDVADVNRDGFDDFFVADMLSREHQSRVRQRGNALRLKELNLPVNDLEYRPEVLRNTLYLSRGDGTYAELACFSGLDATEWTWSAAFLDVDLDGFEDLLITNGNLHDVLDADTLKAIASPTTEDPATRHLKNLLKFPRIETANLCFRNRGDLTFEETGAAWGFNANGISHGLALADLDNDGDLDVVINNLNQSAGLYRNNSSAPRIAVRLAGKAPNHQGIGARIKVEGGPFEGTQGRMFQSQHIVCGGRYLSSDEPLRVFAAGTLTNSLTLDITWRSGLHTIVTNARANRLYVVAEADAVPLPLRQAQGGPLPVTTNPPALFEDLSQRLAHRHVDEPFNDFQRQPLLPRRLSRLGPSVAWFDLDSDGYDDLLIGAGKGGRMGAFKNDGKGGFTPLVSAALDTPENRDQTSLLGWRKEDAQVVVLAGSSNYEDAGTNGAMLRVFNFSDHTVSDGFRVRPVSAGPMAMADIDGDGDLDLFLGGRVLPAGFPEPVPSILFRNESGRFRPDAENSQRLGRAGMVSGALFTDLNGDGFAELILACEWGPLRIYRNEHGKFSVWDWPVRWPGTQEQLTLSQVTGWWNAVNVGDFDNDGQLDIVAANWGRNSRYQASFAQPLQIWWGPFAGAGALDVLEAHFEPGLNKVVPYASLDVLIPTMPFLQEQFPTYRAYGQASVEEILGSRRTSARRAETRTLDSMVFLNRGDHFDAQPLPAEAQWAPAYGVSVADANGDGHEDVFLSQNFFDVEPEVSRADAGRGLWLMGDGQGHFRAMPGQESGIKVYGQQRGCAVSDFDADGRVDLVVTQNGAETKLYRNQGARVGLRVRLKGPSANPMGIGAVMRLRAGDKWGPARELHSGSGYWSQDSAVQVLAATGTPTELFLRWSGGKTNTVLLPPQANEVTIDTDGRISSKR